MSPALTSWVGTVGLTHTLGKAHPRRKEKDAADAEAICAAATSQTMLFVRKKSAERQGVLVLHRSCGRIGRKQTF